MSRGMQNCYLRPVLDTRGVSSQGEIVRGIHPLAPLELPLSDARGCVLHEAVQAPGPVPAFATATLEGYAVRAGAYSPGESLRVVDEVPAGFRASEELVDGTCIKVWPGAPIPPGADAVVATEASSADEFGIRLPAVRSGEGILAVGSIFEVGETLAHAGDLVTAEVIGRFARCGIRSVSVHPRPRVLVLTMGTEFVEPGVPTPIGLVADYLSYESVARAEEAGALASRLPAILDDLGELTEVVADNAPRADLVVIVGVLAARLGAVAEALELDQTTEPSHAVIGEFHGAVVLIPAAESMADAGTLIIDVIGAQRGLPTW